MASFHPYTTPETCGVPSVSKMSIATVGLNQVRCHVAGTVLDLAHLTVVVHCPGMVMS